MTPGEKMLLAQLKPLSQQVSVLEKEVRELKRMQHARAHEGQLVVYDEHANTSRQSSERRRGGRAVKHQKVHWACEANY